MAIDFDAIRKKFEQNEELGQASHNDAVWQGWPTLTVPEGRRNKSPKLEQGKQMTLNETNRIYIVSNERNMNAAVIHGGLYANVGQTKHSVAERLRGNDYARKACGGKLKILFDQEVGSLFRDQDLHPHLKAHRDVVWVKSTNTEEFLFKNDPGDGSVAKKIVGDLLNTLCLPLIQKEVKRLQAEDFVSKNKIVSLSARVDELSSSEYLEALSTKVNRLEKELFVKNEELDDKNKELAQTIKNQILNTTTILNRFEKEKNKELFIKNKELDDKNEELAQTIKSSKNQKLEMCTIVNRFEKELDDKNEELAKTIKSSKNQKLEMCTILNRFEKEKNKELFIKNKELDDKNKELFIKNKALDDKNEEFFVKNKESLTALFQFFFIVIPAISACLLYLS